MDPSLVFRIANLLPLPVWGIWMLAPRSRAARALAGALWPWAILCALYAVLIGVGMALGGGFDPASFSTLAGVMALFQSPWGTLAGWVHYLAFDLFVARWIINDAPDAGYRLTPILLLTLMFGPAGLLLYLALRGVLRPAPSSDRTM